MTNRNDELVYSRHERADPIHGFSGIAAIALQRSADAAERRKREWTERRLEVLKAAKPNALDLVRNEELREFFAMKNLGAKEGLAELKRVEKLHAEFTAEIEALGRFNPDAPEHERQRFGERAKAINRRWATMDLFGAVRANDTNFLGFPISGDPVFEKPDGETIVGTPLDPASFFAEGWKQVRCVPDFSGRIETLRKMLRDFYQRGDTPKEVEAAKERFIDAKLALSDHIESGRALIRRANVAPSRFEKELAAFRAERVALERAIQSELDGLINIGVDPRSF